MFQSLRTNTRFNELAVYDPLVDTIQRFSGLICLNMRESLYNQDLVIIVSITPIFHAL